ncbi:Mechanosensitive ion channel protein [Actinidia chinensis var. chinensis]|uniref:Mechanosensitive ion channel protein n=1 Tax=Actinidia chinensis var. chinensis TaxID=1590841 RepID=A0A2R6PZG5_ACTCC|nr:Mechanosensitive ion channel protein [Actinidia chinensis var. chinensis]
MDKLRKSFKSISDQTHQNQSLDERYVLLQQPPPDPMAQRDVVVKINCQNNPRETELSSPSPSPSPSNPNDVVGGNRVWRDSSHDFSSEATAKVVREFDIAAASPPLSEITESPSYDQFTPRDAGVSFNEANVHRRSNASAAAPVGGGEEVLVCSSNSSFERKSTLMRQKSKSRLMDPPEPNHTSRVLKSGVLGKVSEVDEDDPFLEDDLPLEYKTMEFTTLSVLQLVSLILIIAAFACTLAFPRFRRKTLFELELWKWEVIVLVLISGRLVSGWAIQIGVFFIERNFLLRKRVLYFVYGVRNAVQNCVWLGLVLIAWQCLFDKKLERLTNGKVLHVVTKIWICLLVGTIIWLLKTLLVKVLASSFHVSTFFDRIQDSLFNQYVIERLSGPPWVEIQKEQEEEEKIIAEVEKIQNAGKNVPAELRANVCARREKVIRSGRHQRTPKSAKGTPRFSTTAMSHKLDEGITIDQLHSLNQYNVSAWNMKRLMNIVRRGVISTLDEQIQDSTGENESAVEITSENQAKAAAKKIFYNVAKLGSKYIHIEDLMRFLREDEALETMHLIEGASDGKGIIKRALKNWMVNAYRERRALALSLNDTKTAVNKLHQMLNVAIGVVLLVIWLLILKITSTHFFVFIGSQLLLVAFMFGNSCKTTFEAVIFLFVMHPFDVGDRCEVDGVQMVVEEMNILTTIFLRYDNQKIIYPNSVLATKPISNYYRSPDMGDAIDFCIHIATPVEKIALMKARITRHIDNKSDHWHPAPMIVLRDVEDMNRLKISLWLSHRMNHQDMGERWVRRSLLVEEMNKIFRELDIEYRMLPLDVNVRNMPARTSTRLPSNWNTGVN